jgi:hypothetical protein
VEANVCTIAKIALDQVNDYRENINAVVFHNKVTVYPKNLRTKSSICTNMDSASVVNDEVGTDPKHDKTCKQRNSFVLVVMNSYLHFQHWRQISVSRDAVADLCTAKIVAELTQSVQFSSPSYRLCEIQRELFGADCYYFVFAMCVVCV